MGKGHGINCADLFGDGRMCILNASGGAYPGELMTTAVYAPPRAPRQLPGGAADRDEEQPRSGGKR